jgi:hypothetical protein
MHSSVRMEFGVKLIGAGYPAILKDLYSRSKVLRQTPREGNPRYDAESLPETCRVISIPSGLILVPQYRRHLCVALILFAPFQQDYRKFI